MVENGKAPQIQRRTVWADLPAEYEGFKVEVWVNAPTKLWTSMQNPETSEAEKQEAASKLIIAHNGWLDFDGNEYPPPSEAKFWEDIPTELAACVFATAYLEMQRLPNSLAPNNRRSKRG